MGKNNENNNYSKIFKIIVVFVVLINIATIFKTFPTISSFISFAAVGVIGAAVILIFLKVTNIGKGFRKAVADLFELLFKTDNDKQNTALNENSNSFSWNSINTNNRKRRDVIRIVVALIALYISLSLFILEKSPEEAVQSLDTSNQAVEYIVQGILTFNMGLFFQGTKLFFIDLGKQLFEVLVIFVIFVVISGVAFVIARFSKNKNEYQYEEEDDFDE